MPAPDIAVFADGRVFAMLDDREIARAEPRGNLIEQLFKEPDGSFVRVSSRITLDGRPLKNDEDTFETHPELYRGNLYDPLAIAERKRRLGIIRRARVLTLPEVIRWAVVMHVPDSLAGAVLDSLTLPSVGGGWFE